MRDRADGRSRTAMVLATATAIAGVVATCTACQSNTGSMHDTTRPTTSASTTIGQSPTISSSTTTPQTSPRSPTETPPVEPTAPPTTPPATTSTPNTPPAATTYFGPADPAWNPSEGSLTPALTTFVKTHRGTYSIVVIHPETGRILGAVNPDKEFFTASIYKLHVAYDGYRAIDAGRYRGTQPYLGGYTRAQCLDAMIRSSYSPCAERWWTELGRERLDELAESRGFTHTDLVGLRSTARDSAGLLRLVYLGTGLSSASQRAFLDSMRDQPAKYRAGLPSGMPGQTVYDKVGWNLDHEWHDVAIVDFGAGRRVIVAAFTTGAGYANVRALGRLVATRLTR